MSGSFQVTIEFSSRGPEMSQRPNRTLPPITQEAINHIPRRVADAQGNAGDNVNLVVVAAEPQFFATFQAAGWVKVDRTRNDAIVQPRWQPCGTASICRKPPLR